MKSGTNPLTRAFPGAEGACQPLVDKAFMLHQAMRDSSRRGDPNTGAEILSVPGRAASPEDRLVPVNVRLPGASLDFGGTDIRGTPRLAPWIRLAERALVFPHT